MQNLEERLDLKKIAYLYNSKKISHKLVTFLLNSGQITTDQYLNIIWEESQDLKRN